ncbi:MAG TPA: hypothetical protein VHV30_09290 [Polyangiaceae bacterium]|nr:hypothetical protein [Polyangiaceae bacterium]
MSAPRRPDGLAIGATGVGLALLAIGLAVDPTRAWFAYLDAWIFGVTLAIGALIVTLVGQASKAGWMVVVRRPMEAVAGSLPLFAILFVPIAFGLGHLYPWAAAHPPESAVAGHKALWLSKPFFLARTAVYFAILSFFALRIRGMSRANDVRPSAALVRGMRRLGGGGIPVVGLVLSFASFDWSMSLQPDWSSTMFGIYFFAGAFVGAIALACVLASTIPLAGPGRPDASSTPGERLERRSTNGSLPSPDHAQALGRLLFAMVIFWAYVSFGQLIVYWMGDEPEEVSFFLRRTTGSWAAVTWVLVFGHFVLPFFGLLNRPLKRRLATLRVAGAWMLAMHYLDVYWQVLPVHDAAGARPHWLDLGALLFVAGLATAWVARAYRAAPPLPANVPELDEGLAYEAAV